MNVTITGERPQSFSRFSDHPVGEHREIASLKGIEFRNMIERMKSALRLPFEVKAYGAYKYSGFDTFGEWLLHATGGTEADLLSLVEVMGLDIADLDKGDSTKGGEYEALHARAEKGPHDDRVRQAILAGIPELEGQEDYETARAQLLAGVAERKRQEAERKAEQERWEQLGELAQQELRDMFKQLMKEGSLPKNRVHIKVRHDQYGRYYVTLQSSVKRIYKSEDGVLSYLDGTKQRVPLDQLYTIGEIDFMESVIRRYAEVKGMEILSLLFDGQHRDIHQTEDE